jgi:hypothetical protein
MNLKDYLIIDAMQKERLRQLDADYRQMRLNPQNATPKIIIEQESGRTERWETQLEDPLKMLKAELDDIKFHFELGDDRVPSVRVQFGTAQVAAAFGAELYIPENNAPAAKTHPLKNIEDIYTLGLPSYEAGWYGKLKHFTEVFKENLPEGVHIQHPDIQSPFNNAHLIRGNDILTDFYDNPEAVDALLDKVTDYMIKMVPYLKEMVSGDREWFYDWGSLWQGTARISNCTMQMIKPDFYKEHIYPRDCRFFAAIGGGRVHYCGLSESVIEHFFSIPGLSGFDFDANHLDFRKVCEKAPENVVVAFFANPGSASYDLLVNGDWPKKRNIIVISYVKSKEEGKQALSRLRESVRTASS